MQDSFIETLHTLRKQVDANIKAVNSWKKPQDGNMGMTEGQRTCQRELALAYTKLQEAKMWLGKCLEVAGAPFPPESGCC